MRDERVFIVLDGVARSILYDHALDQGALDAGSGCMNMKQLKPHRTRMLFLHSWLLQFGLHKCGLIHTPISFCHICSLSAYHSNHIPMTTPYSVNMYINTPFSHYTP